MFVFYLFVPFQSHEEEPPTNKWRANSGEATTLSGFLVHLVLQTKPHNFAAKAAVPTVVLLSVVLSIQGQILRCSKLNRGHPKQPYQIFVKEMVVNHIQCSYCIVPYSWYCSALSTLPNMWDENPESTQFLSRWSALERRLQVSLVIIGLHVVVVPLLLLIVQLLMLILSSKIYCSRTPSQAMWHPVV